MPNLQQLSASQISPEIPVNENFETLSAVAIFGKRHPDTALLTWAYYGGYFNSVLVADGAVTLTASATNYVTVNRTTGVVSTSTTTAQWDDTTTNARLYRLVTDAAGVTSAQDHRFGSTGIMGGGSGGGGGGMTNPMNAVGDIIIGGTSGAAQRLGIGSTGQVLTSVGGSPAWADAGAASTLVPVNNQSGTAYTLQLSDVGKKLRMNNAGAITVTVPTQATLDFPIGTVIALRQVGAGKVTLVGDGSTVVNYATGYTASTGRQGAEIMLHKVAANEWDLTGDMGAV